MANLQLSEFQSMMSDEIGDSGNDTNNTRYLNMAVSFAWKFAAWPEKKAKAFVNTVAPVVTGTVDVTNDSTSVVENAGTPDWTSPSVAGYKFALSYTDTPYTIASVSDADTVVLAQAYIGATATDVSYVMYNDVVKLAADVDTINAVWLHDTDRAYPLRLMTEDELDRGDHYARQVDRPWFYCIEQNASDGARQIRVGPYAPDAVYRIEYKYEKSYTALSSATDTTGLDEALDDAILEMALGMAYRRDHFNRSQQMRSAAREMLREEWRRFAAASPNITYLERRSDIREISTYPADFNDLEI